MEYASAACRGGRLCRELCALFLLTRPQSLGAPSSADAIALFGHAVFHNAVAWRIARFWGASDQVLADLTALDLGEAEGLWITQARAGDEERLALPCCVC